MRIIPKKILLSGEIEIEILNNEGQPIMEDVGLGTPYGRVHHTKMDILEGLGFTKEEILELPSQVNDYSYLPEAGDSEFKSFHEGKNLYKKRLEP